ncbi:hypothetical protein CHUAL_006205 [Chamberlinius hualienensis]
MEIMLTEIIYILLLWIRYHVEGNVRDETELFACDDHAVQIQCQSRLSTIAVYNATFVSINATYDQERPNCDRIRSLAEGGNVTCTDDVRLIVNQRCSGVSSCIFTVTDLVPRECFGAGILSLVYGCVSAADVVRHCGMNVVGNTAEGFIQNPGYPNYYSRMKCKWTVSGDAGQTVLVSVLDMSLLATTAGQSAVDCRDSLQLFDGQLKTMHACGWDNAYLHTFQSNSNEVTIVFNSQDVWPSRGFLIYYRVLGCATLPAPMHGYLVYRNTSLAHYMCCARHVFVDDYKRNKILFCEDGNKWNGSVTLCKSIKVLRQWSNSSGAEFEEDGLMSDSDPIRQVAPHAANIIYDIVIPSVIMAAMVVCNIVIVLVILRVRRSKHRETVVPSAKAEEEMAFQQQQEPSTSKRNGHNNGYHELSPRRAPLARVETGV